MSSNNAIIRAILESTNPSNFISLDTVTIPVLKGGKRNKMQGHVVKRVTGSNVMIFQNLRSNAYENMVQRRLKSEGKNPNDFQLQPRKWGTRVTGTPFVEHNGKVYLEVIFLNPGKVEYFLDGKSIQKNEIIGLEDREESEQGGLENKVIIRTYALESIVRITIDKQEVYNFNR